MNKDQVKGATNDAAGELFGSREQQRLSDQVSGGVQEPLEEHQGSEMIYFGKSQ